MKDGTGGGRAGPRDASTRVALVVKVLAGAGALVVGGIRYGLLGVVIVVSLGLGLAVLSQRRKAAPVPGHRWAAPADLLLGGRKFPGQLSVLGDAIVWRPSRHSVRHGLGEVHADTSFTAHVNAGPALADVYLTLTAPDGGVTTFLTRRSSRLVRAVEQFGTRNP